jgi:hypothetical protein
MLPDVATLLAKIYGSTETLTAEIARLSSRDLAVLKSEITNHLALRFAFLVAGELSGSGNYPQIRERLSKLLPDRTEQQIDTLSGEFAKLLITIDSSDAGQKLGLQGLPYPTRRRIYELQGHRCAVCGWGFRTANITEREDWECVPCLDHIVPHRVGGEQLKNLRITCTLCNTIKEATLHIGEQGRVWTNNYVFRPQSRAVAYWTLVRDQRCTTPDCGNAPSNAQLFVERISSRGLWVVDNCRTRCHKHLSVAPQDTLPY